MQQTKKMDEPIKNFCTDALLFDIKKLQELFEIGRTLHILILIEILKISVCQFDKNVLLKVAASTKTINQQDFP
jgi:hypothetical protein